jgi:retron-type reverse transcriptase
VYIPTADGRQRPIGGAAIEDKVVQKAVAEVMSAVYEEGFLGFSYGFRPKRSQHQVLDALSAGVIYKKVNYVLDADIRSFFTLRIWNPSSTPACPSRRIARLSTRIASSHIPLSVG